LYLSHILQNNFICSTIYLCHQYPLTSLSVGSWSWLHCLWLYCLFTSYVVFISKFILFLLCSSRALSTRLYEHTQLCTPIHVPTCSTIHQICCLCQLSTTYCSVLYCTVLSTILPARTTCTHGIHKPYPVPVQHVRTTLCTHWESNFDLSLIVI
jgi:hypothetical protein